MPPETTRDAFLGGRLVLEQPAGGYRAGTDAVLLAAAVPARPGERVLELGCGAAAAILCLAVRVPGLHLAAVEIQPAYATLAQRNAEAAGAALDLHVADLAALPAALALASFDHVIANPPYFRRGDGARGRDRAPDDGRETAMGEATPLPVWIATAERRLVPGGCLTLIQRIERLPDVLSALSPGMGAVDVLPLAARIGRPPGLFVMRARKGRRTPFRLLPARSLHSGDAHGGDRPDYTPELQDVLRNAAPLPWP